MKFCNDERCPFHEIDPDNIVEELKGQFGKHILGLVIRPLKPTVKDHLLFIPKEHHKYFHDYEPSNIMMIMMVIKRYIEDNLTHKEKIMADNIQYTVLKGSEDYNIVIQNGKLAGQSVPHLHIHLIPRNGVEDTFNIEWNKEPSGEVTLFDTKTGEPYAKINGLAEGNKFNEM